MNTVLRTAQPAPALLAKRLADGGYQQTEDGLEKLCSKCLQYWPADNEFFQVSSSADGLMCWCKACHSLARAATRAAKVAIEAPNYNEQHTTPREEMSMQTSELEVESLIKASDEELLELIRKKPQIRAMQVADLLDIDVDMAESKLSALERSQRIVSELIMAPNKCEVKGYSINPAFLGWKAPEQPATSGEHAAPPARDLAPQTATPIALKASSTPAGRAAGTQMKEPSKTQLAIDYMKKHGATDGTKLKEVMGIPRTSSVRNYLAHPIRNGRVIAIDDVFSLAPDEQAAAAVQSPPLAAPAPVEAEPPALLDPRIVELVRTNLPAAEYRGFLKAGALQHILFPASENSVIDYEIAGIYISLLADHASEGARQ